jgi:hypothetical protein
VKRSSLVVVIATTAFVSAVVATSAALVAVDMTRPSDRELQRAAADELGVPAFLLDAPGAQAVTDDLAARVSHRVIDEARPSIALGLTVGILTGAATAVTSAATLARLGRRHRLDAAD